MKRDYLNFRVRRTLKIQTASQCVYLLPAVLGEALKNVVLLLSFPCSLYLVLKNTFIQTLGSYWVCFPLLPFACHLELGGVCVRR